MAEAVYVGSRGVNLPLNNFNLNQLDPEHQKLGNSALGQLVTNPFFGVITDPLSALSRATVTRESLLRPYPQYNALNYSRPLANMGGSDYHSLQLKLQKRFAAVSPFWLTTPGQRQWILAGWAAGSPSPIRPRSRISITFRDEWSLSTGDVPAPLSGERGLRAAIRAAEAVSQEDLAGSRSVDWRLAGEWFLHLADRDAAWGCSPTTCLGSATR
jgi:hypothetical protein